MSKLQMHLTAAEADAALLAQATRAANEPDIGLTWVVPTMNRVALPPMQGWTYGLGGRSGHMKSTLLSAQVKHWCKELEVINAKLGADDPLNVGVWIKLEESIEMARWLTWTNRSLGFVDIVNGRVNLPRLEKVVAGEPKLPLIIAGDSLAADMVVDAEEMTSAAFTTLGLWNLIDGVEKGSMRRPMRVRFIAVDYLQLLGDKAESRDMATRMVNVPHELRRIAALAKCPILIAAQANLKKQFATAGSNLIPRLSDIEWSGAMGQDLFSFTGLYRPCRESDMIAKSMPGLNGSGPVMVGPTIKVGGQEYFITRDLLVLRIDKWRLTFEAETTTVPIWFDVNGFLTEQYPYAS